MKTVYGKYINNEITLDDGKIIKAYPYSNISNIINDKKGYFFIKTFI